MALSRIIDLYVLIALAGIVYLRCKIALVGINHCLCEIWRCRRKQLWCTGSANICQGWLEKLWSWAKHRCWPLRVGLYFDTSKKLWVFWCNGGSLPGANRTFLQVSSWCLARIKLNQTASSHRVLTLRCGVRPIHVWLRHTTTWRNFRKTPTGWGSNQHLLDNSFYTVLISTGGLSCIIDKTWPL